MLSYWIRWGSCPGSIAWALSSSWGEVWAGQEGIIFWNRLYYDRPILIGPHMENFREIAELFLSQEAALCVKDASDLAERLRWLLLHPQVAREMGERAGLLLRRHQGATQRTLDLLKAYL